MVATIGGTKGILVVGGATGTDDMVEWLDWETKDKWVVLGKLNRGRGKYIIIRDAPNCFICNEY